MAQLPAPVTHLTRQLLLASRTPLRKLHQKPFSSTTFSQSSSSTYNTTSSAISHSVRLPRRQNLARRQRKPKKPSSMVADEIAAQRPGGGDRAGDKPANRKVSSGEHERIIDVLKYQSSMIEANSQKLQNIVKQLKDMSLQMSELSAAEPMVARIDKLSSAMTHSERAMVNAIENATSSKFKKHEALLDKYNKLYRRKLLFAWKVGAAMWLSVLFLACLNSVFGETRKPTPPPSAHGAKSPPPLAVASSTPADRHK